MTPAGGAQAVRDAPRRCLVIGEAAGIAQMASSTASHHGFPPETSDGEGEDHRRSVLDPVATASVGRYGLNSHDVSDQRLQVVTWWIRFGSCMLTVVEPVRSGRAAQ